MYESFANKHQLARIGNVDWEIETEDVHGNLCDSAQLFETHILSVLEITTAKQQLSDAKWTGVLRKLLVNLHPLVKTSLKLTGTIAGVDIQRSKQMLTG
jgi:hypothetical protein